MSYDISIEGVPHGWVKVSTELLYLMTQQASDKYETLTIEWGDRDAEGFYSPTITKTYNFHKIAEDALDDSTIRPNSE